MKALMCHVRSTNGLGFQDHLAIAVKSIFLATAITGATAAAVAAQSIRSDGTLSTNVDVSLDGLSFTINDGDRVGDNLFHSFDVFSVPTMGTAVFANPVDITNIIGRVTGDVPSSIDGLIQANGGANLFLLNPKGIVFGEKAQLDIGGSFIGTTAESLRFSDDVEFSAVVATPMLSISRPTGLRLSSTSRGIDVNDGGYQVLSDLPLQLDSSASLQVKPGNTLALVGSGIALDGGAIATPGGRIELGGVQDGLVALTNDVNSPGQWVLGYDEVQTFGDIELLSQSLLNTSDLLFGSNSPQPIGFGAHGGDIQLQGRQISVRDGSIGLIQNFGNNDFGNIRVSASNLIEVEGVYINPIDASQQVNSGFATTSFGLGQGGNISIDTRQLYATEEGTIITETFGPANGGNLVVKATDNIFFELANEFSLDSGKLFSVSYGDGIASSIDGNAGSIEVRTGQLVFEDSGIASQSIGSGSGGRVRVYTSAFH